MQHVLEFLVAHGYVFLFLFVLAEQIGLPTPALPVMLAAGALARRGELSFSAVVLVSVAGCLLADAAWYELGRRRGAGVLTLLCRLSLEPDSCVRRTGDVFHRFGPLTLIGAKFLPGLGTVAPPMAGAMGMTPARFLALDAAGAFVWSTALIGVGYAFSDQLERIVGGFVGFGTRLLWIAALGLGVYVAFKFLWRRRILRAIAIARISPEDLKARIDDGDPPAIVDLRQRLEAHREPHTIPGALHIPAEELESERARIPLDREIVLFCT